MTEHVLTLNADSWKRAENFTYAGGIRIFHVVQEWVWGVRGRDYSYVAVNGVELHKDTALAVILTMGITE